MRSYESARTLVARGHSVLMVCGSYDGSDTGLSHLPFIRNRRRGFVDGIEVLELFLPYSNKYSLLKRTAIFLRYAISCIRIALTAQYDLLFATTTPLTVALPGIVMKLFRKKPFVFEVRDLWPELPKAMGAIRNPLVLGALSLLEWCAYHSADFLIGLSPGIAEGISKRGIPKEKVETIPNGCDTDVFQPAAEKALALPGLAPAKLTCIFSGTHGTANGLDAVLDTAATLKQRGAEGIRLLLIGNGNQKKRLMQRAAKEALTNVVFLNPVPKTEVAMITANCDVGLMILANVPAFYYGTSPNKFFDYIACGLPVLNNYPGWLGDMITKTECGIVVPPDNPVKFADALEFLLNNPEKRKLMGQNALQLVREFDRKALAQRMCDRLEKVAGIYGSPA